MKSNLFYHKPIKLLLVCSLIMLILGCKKFIGIDPPNNEISDKNIFETEFTATSVLTGILANMSNDASNFVSVASTVGLSYFSGIYTDELILYNKQATINETAKRYYENDLDDHVQNFWTDAYRKIYAANAAYEGVSASGALSQVVREQLLGEALFIRSFYYLYLVDYYGEVPLPLSTDYKKNATLKRSSTSAVYAQIVNDLKEAQSLLSDNFLASDVKTPTAERVRPTKWAATALLARAYLNSGDYANAELEASRIIDNHDLFGMSSVGLNQVFSMNSPETIWALQCVATPPYANSVFGPIFILGNEGPQVDHDPLNPVCLSDELLKTFEIGDNRKADWIGSVTVDTITYFYAYKYKAGYDAPVNTENFIVLRMGEQYLIRAEARVRQGKFAEAKEDLNAVRIRAGLANTTATDGDLLSAVLHERQVELFTEWGDRFSSLKRIDNTINNVMPNVSTKKGGTWQSFKSFFPIPFEEIKLNPSIAGNQNQGY